MKEQNNKETKLMLVEQYRQFQVIINLLEDSNFTHRLHSYNSADVEFSKILLCRDIVDILIKHMNEKLDDVSKELKELL